jgi:YD repeat-containing protein
MRSRNTVCQLVGITTGLLLASQLFAETGPTRPAVETQRTFAEPLVPVGEPGAVETGQLARALDAYRAAGNIEAVQPLIGFLTDYPSSPWKPSLLANLAVLYRHTGYISRALETAAEAWRITKQSSAPETKKIADSALATYVELTAALGRTDALAALLDEVRARPLSGQAAEMVSRAWSGLWLMRHDPEGSFRCGPLAVERVSQALHPDQSLDPRLLRYPSSNQGTSLAEIATLARTTGLPLRAFKRERGSEIPVPAVVHWKAGHFAAIVAQNGDRFLTKDLTFGDDHWVSRAAVEAESTGYMLVARPATSEQGWRPVDDAEGAAVRGKGATGNPNPGSTAPTDPKKPNCGSGGNGMPAYDFHLAIVSLNVTDTPVGYVPPRGPAIQIGITYNSREDFQPATFTFTNMGSRWSFNWLSYIEDDDPNNAGQTIRLAERGGGSFILPWVSGNPFGTYGPNVRGFHERVVRTIQNGATVSFVRQFPDGSQDVYGQSDNATTMRKYFLTSVSDPAGNTVTLSYDTATSRLLYINDALAQRTTLAYGLSGDIYKVTSVTDPFGRQAFFQYASGVLQSVTDAAGMTSSFAYGPASYDPALAVDFMNSLKTPYGTTTFDMGENAPQIPADIGNVRWLVATDPLGNRERIEFIHEAAGIPDATTEPVPAGFQNKYLSYRNTFYWNQTAMQHYTDGDPNRYLNATYLFHWLHDTTGGPNNVAASSVLESLQTQGQHRIWFAYPGQQSSIYQGSLSTPTRVAQVLDSGQEQRVSRTYDASGRMQSLTDPAGRTYSFHYASNGIDLASLRNDVLNGGLGEQMAALTYNSLHLPLTFTGYSGQTYSATYNAFGQLASLTRPDGATTNLTYDAQGFLKQVARAGTAFQENYLYDAVNRLRTWTSTDGYTLTFDYDNLDRLTKITYPDGSSESIVFDRLDVVEVHDRMGRVSKYEYDPADRLVSVTDPAQRTTTFSWCSCGALDQVTDPLGHQTTWLRDGLNRETGKQINGRTNVLYDYDGSGRLLRRTDALNQVTSYSYNVDDTPAAVAYQNAVHPTPGVSYQWDLAYPRRALMTDAFGTTIYTYNPAGVPGAGQLASIVAPAPSHTITFQYDSVGRRTSSAVDGVALTTTYDAEDRLASLTSPIGHFSASYDGSSGRLTGFTYPYPNQLGPTLSYLDAAHDFRLSRLFWGPAAAPGSFNLSQFDYTYDSAHDQITALAWHDVTNQTGRFFTFGYDGAQQLIGRQQTTDPTQSPVTVQHTTGFGYDRAGNRTSETIDTTISTSTFDGANQLVAIERGLTLHAQAVMEAARSRTATLPLGKPHPMPSGHKPEGGGQ